MKPMFVFVLFASLAYGHNWMRTPMSYNMNRAQAGNLPCNDEAAAYTEGAYSVGESISVSWTTNHGNSHYLKVVALADIAGIEDLATDPVDSALIHYTEYPDKAINTASIAITAEEYPPGTYVLQYKWNNYRNCARFTVSAADPGNVPTTPSDSPLGTEGPNAIGQGDCNSYCADFQTQCATTQYAFSDANECLSSCALYPTTGQDRDPTGNTFQCRWYHLHPETHPDDEVHCSHASRLSTSTTCQGGEYQVGASLRIQTTTPDASQLLRGYVDDCLAQTGYTAYTISEPIQGDGAYTIELIFTDTGRGESPDAKLASIQVDQRPLRCMVDKPEVTSFLVNHFIEPNGNMGSPTILFPVIISLCALFR